MAKRVFLHIGTMKAATSYLQALLTENSVLLAESGWLWSGTGENRRAVGDLIGPQARFPGDEGAWGRMAGEIRRFEGDAVISMELLAPLRERKLERVVRSLGDAERHVILTARELTRVIPSQWQEGMQSRRPAGWAEFIKEVCADDPDSELGRRFWNAHDLARIIRAWSAVAPYDRISVVTVPPPGGDPTLVWKRFSSVLGLDGDRFRQPAPQNESLGAVSAELMRRVNAEVADLAYPVYRHAFRRTLAKRVLAPRAKSEPRLTLPAEQHAWVRGRSERMLREVEALGVHVAGDLADLVPPAEPRAEAVDPADASTSELLAAATDGLVGLGRILGELQIEHKRLAEQNARLRRRLDDAADPASEAPAPPPAPGPLGQRLRRPARRSRTARWLVRRLRTVRNSASRRR